MKIQKNSNIVKGLYLIHLVFHIFINVRLSMRMGIVWINMVSLKQRCKRFRKINFYSNLTRFKKSLYLNVCSPVVCVGVSNARSQQVQIEFGPKDVRAHVLEKSKYTIVSKIMWEILIWQPHIWTNNFL